MPATYEPIGTTTVSGTSTTTITFSSIPQTYTDLVLVSSVDNSTDVVNYLRFNSDTGTNYSRTTLRGTGSVADSTRSSSQTFITFSFGTLSSPVTVIWHILNYSNTTTYKSCVSRNSNTFDSVGAVAGLWQSTAAISTVSVTVASGYIVADSTFTLYGIKAA